METNEISQIGSRHCGKRNYIGFESRISGGGTAEFCEFSLSNMERIFE